MNRPGSVVSEPELHVDFKDVERFKDPAAPTAILHPSEAAESLGTAPRRFFDLHVSCFIVFTEMKCNLKTRRRKSTCRVEKEEKVPLQNDVCAAAVEERKVSLFFTHIYV